MQIKLTTTGRKSGRDRDPDWAGNLRAEPKATLSTGKESFEVTAHELAGAARAPAWELVVERFPMYATYQRKTTRQIPVFALKRR